MYSCTVKPGLASEPDSTPYEVMRDEEVAIRARDALKKAIAFPLGSAQRAIQWAVFDAATGELERRAARYEVARLRRPGLFM